MMKKTPLIIMLLLSQAVMAQQKKQLVFNNYPAITNAAITDVAGNATDVNWLAPGQKIVYSFNLVNLSQEPIPGKLLQVKVMLQQHLKPSMPVRAIKDDFINWLLVKDEKAGNYLLGTIVKDIAADELRQHIIPLQCTGIGKSQIILSLLYNNEPSGAENALWFTVDASPH